MNSPILFNGINILGFPFLLPFTEKPKPCVAWQPSEEQAVCLPGDPVTARPKLCVQSWMCGTLIGSDKAALGLSLLHRSHERLPESQNTTS